MDRYGGVIVQRWNKRVRRLIAVLAVAVPATAPAQLPGDKKVFVPPYGERGCWVLLFAGKEFDPPVAKLNGPTFIERFENAPVEEPALKAVGGAVFLRSIQSAIVGPRARLVGYEDIKYSKRSVVLEPKQQVPDLVEVRFHERVSSLQVECAQ